MTVQTKQTIAAPARHSADAASHAVDGAPRPAARSRSTVATLLALPRPVQIIGGAAIVIGVLLAAGVPLAALTPLLALGGCLGMHLLMPHSMGHGGGHGGHGNEETRRPANESPQADAPAGREQ